MKCKEFRNHLFEIVDAQPGGELAEHMRSCAACAGELEAVRRTLTLLDEWQGPADTSPYFHTRLRARLRDEAARPAGWMAWLPKPALAVSLTALLAVGIGLFRGGSNVQPPNKGGKTTAVLQPGTAVGDLQYLDKNHDLLADFDLLDELDVQNR